MTRPKSPKPPRVLWVVFVRESWGAVSIFSYRNEAIARQVAIKYGSVTSVHRYEASK